MDLPIDVRQALPLQERAAELATLADYPERAAHVVTPHPIAMPATIPLAQAAALLVALNQDAAPLHPPCG
jgi:hypothetical protein